MQEALDAYQKALDLDPTNQIARRNIDRLAALRDAPVSSAADAGGYAACSSRRRAARRWRRCRRSTRRWRQCSTRATSCSSKCRATR
ncbi:tetratricopeptide repeat protein [Tepidiforma flava]|uniref:Tetratricopeptide repeat protein n=1 Tax=Tepidiforma flava TaxID=3004094 RepID=A0ABY7M401_9CHLR|nr:tetratricopeptide repeat protein [Tepidiforma flava]WBL35266.1 tetratricopeptide repeat protein [Tepidiforma flava]